MQYQPLPPWPDLRDFSPDDVIKRRSDLRLGAVFFMRTSKRVYLRELKTGRAGGGPLARYEFEAFKVLGENRTSWLVGWHKPHNDDLRKADRVNKKAPALAFGLDDVEDALSLGHRHRIARIVERLQDIEALRSVAAAVGYQMDATEFFGDV